MLQIVPSTQNGRTILKLEGELSIYEVSEARQELRTRLEAAPDLELDLSGITGIDTAGLQVLYWLKQEAKALSHHLPLVHHSAAVIEVFDLFNLAADFGDPILISPIGS
jgi:anti-anti-sigma factor